MAANKFIPITVQVALGNAKAVIGTVRDELKGVAKDVKDVGSKLSGSFAGLKESLGGKLSGGLSGITAGLGEMSAASLTTATAVTGAALAVGQMTLRLAASARDITNNSRAMGLSVEQYQKYENAAQVAGVSTNTLTEGVNKFRERAVDALKGNKELAESFKVFGINAREAANTPQQAFEKLLDQLQRYPNDVSKANLITRIFGEGHRELSSAVVSLTQNQGELRKQLQATGVVMNAQSAKELSQLNRDYELLTLRVETFAKRSLVGLVQSLKNAASEIDKTGILGLAKQAVFDPAAFSKGFVEPVIGRPELFSAAKSTGISSSVPSLQGLGLGARADALAGKKDKTKTPGGGRGASAPLSEAQQLANQLKELNQQIAFLSDQSSKEYKLRFQLVGAEKSRSELEELLKLRQELGIDGSLDQLRGLSEFNKLSGKRPAITGSASTEFVKQELANREATAKKEKEIAELVAETTETLREQLVDLQSGGKGSSAELTTRNKFIRAGASLKQGEQAIAQAKVVDTQKKYNEALDQARERQEQYVDFIRTQFDNLLESPRRFFDGLKSLFKQSLSNILTGLVTGGNGGGGGGFFKNLAGLATGGGGFSGGGGGGLLSNLFRTPGFNPAAGAGGSGEVSGGGGFFSQISGILGGGGSGGANGGSGLLGLLSGKIGGLFKAGGALGQNVSIGVGSQASSGLGAVLGSFASNPYVLAGAAAVIGGLVLYKFLRKRGQYSRDVKKAVQSQYGVEVSKDVIGQIKSIGQSKYGKDYANRVNETVSSPEVRDLVADYAENTGQKGNASLFNAANLSDPTYRDNRFVTSEAGRGNAFGVGGGFVGTPSIGSSTPNIVQAAQIGAQSLLADAITMLAEKITSIPAAELIIANANAVGEAFKETFSNDAAIGEQIGRAVNP